MPDYRSPKTSTHGRNMVAGARALWRATGMKDEDFKKPIIAIANSFTQFVPGHAPEGPRPTGRPRDREGRRRGHEFNTIAVDDGIAMGPRRHALFAAEPGDHRRPVEYMVNAHCADAIVCISNCDKITPAC